MKPRGTSWVYPRQRADQTRATREDDAGTLTLLPKGVRAGVSCEDSAVSRQRLGEYFADRDALLKEFGLIGIQVAHFSLCTVALVQRCGSVSGGPQYQELLGPSP